MLHNSGGEYFKTMLQPDGPFTESQQTVITLEGDKPYAVEAILQHIYGSDYDPLHTLQYYLNVYVAAQKYLLPGLQEIALTAANRKVAVVGPSNANNPEGVLEVVKLLAEYMDHNEAFMEKCNMLVLKNLPALMRMKAFREWMEEDGNPTVELIAVAIGTPKERTQHVVNICRYCRHASTDDIEKDADHNDCPQQPCQDWGHEWEIKHFSYREGLLEVTRQ